MFTPLGRRGTLPLGMSEGSQKGARPMSYAGREECFEYEALRRAEKMASKKSGTKPAGKQKSLVGKVKELLGAK